MFRELLVYQVVLAKAWEAQRVSRKVWAGAGRENNTSPGAVFHDKELGFTLLVMRDTEGSGLIRLVC